MGVSNKKLQKLLELANRYPSPHNGQPIRLKPDGSAGFQVYFEKERGLQAADISFIFSFVSMGVFMEHLALAARALGHGFSYKLDLPDQAELRGQGLVRFAACRLEWDAAAPDEDLADVLARRQTSRKKYYQDVDDDTAAELVRLGGRHGMKLARLDKPQTKQAIWLNQRAVFDDMSDEPVRRELDHWLRYTRRQKQATQDGLAYDCMELNGRLMKYIVDHPRILRVPGLHAVIQRYYLRTMTDASSVFYMMAPFSTEKEAFSIGQVIMQSWRLVTERGYYLHPFGTIMSNHAAHRDFLDMAGVSDESRGKSYLVFIFRCGKSEVPAASLRLPVKNHLLLEEA